MLKYMRPLFDKIYYGRPDCTEEEYIESVLQEIGVVLANRIRSTDGNNPFNFGIDELQTLNDTSNEVQQNFIQRVQDVLLKHDKRIKNLEIDNISINQQNQTATIYLTVQIKGINYNVKREFIIK